ncbi:P-loop containing nucleoside triphosphate hydrolase protein [Exidia glandulosa HHB12029]|uniref:p-loop containing nucleoside triphosphate hydrolase protein n=1 Tax=Exidia glandulosa HHB12029 TaxID=1314781 RepID=A0A165DWI1_EXIGL|nr:P-loop containing nucleoside triphosphate hydrolase protein [Exidia glandulosa HHB12029]
MAWVKEWDYCVFGTNKRRKRARDEMEGDTYVNTDELQRPRERILLLSGPPGLGKTTLAHVVARQAGYDVMEINASDARTGQVIDDRVRPALESGSAVGSKRPVLVIIDEIDGATGAGDNSGHFVQKLLQLTIDKPAKKGRKKEQGGARPLRRPIICICNDLYAASLAKLRPQARIIRFHKPADVHLVKRLRDICEREGLRPDTRALSTLVGVAQGDMRGCLNTLQFIKAKNQDLSETVVRAATTGMKEADIAFTAVLNNLFTPMSKRRVKELGLREDEETRYVSRLSREVEATGALDKVYNGCFEHYITLRLQDANLERHQKAAEWLCAYDIMSGTMKSEREYAVLPYLPYMAVPFFPLFNERGAPKVERPKADWEHFVKTKQNEEIYKSLNREGRAPEYRHLLSNGILQLEFAPLINRIISPPLRPVNSQVIRPEEKKLLARLVDVMVALDLRFIQEKSEDGNLVYRLDPPIDVFVTYDGKRASDINVSRYAVRHLVASEIDEKAIHRQAEASEATKRHTFTQPATQEQEDEPMHEAAEADDDAAGGRLIAGVANKRIRVAPVAKPVEEKGPVDFFGRPIVVSATKSRKAAAAPIVKKFKVTYKFHEGNSSAVRKPVKVASLL